MATDRPAATVALRLERRQPCPRVPWSWFAQRSLLALCRFLPAFVCAWLLLPGSLNAQTNASPNTSSRYLFIVDTSAAMRRRAPATQKAIDGLLRSSMAAQFQRGDTVGVWTFNEQLNAGRFPLQTWTPETSDLLASNVLRFLKMQTNVGQSRFEVVVPTLQRVVEESPRLTVLLVSDGDERISGTPFDGEIERALASKFREQQRARMPFITVLRAARGRIASATVNLAPWPVDFPKFPPEPKIVETPKPEPKPEPAPRPVVPPLIVIGKKPAPLTNEPVAVVTNAPPAPATPVATEGQPVVAAPPVAPPTNPPPESTPALPVTIQTNVSVPNDRPLPATTSVVVTNPPVAVPVVETNPPVQTAVVAAPPSNPPVAISLVSPPKTNVASAAPVPAPITIAAITPPRVEVTPPSTAVPDPVVAVTPVAVAPTTSEVVVPPAPVTNPPAGVAVAAIAETGSVPWVLIVAGTVPIVLGVGAFIFLQKRARSAGHGSLISRSLDRDRK